MGSISRGFFGRRAVADVKLPPGQYLTTDFPVLSAGPTPQIALEKWEFTIDDGTNVLRRWNWKSFRELPTENITARSALRDAMVEARHALGRRVSRHHPWRDRNRRRVCNGAFLW